MGYNKAYSNSVLGGMVGKNLGHILAGTKIAVDWWETDSTPLVDSYFCSHVTRYIYSEVY